jgi:hypothetical protein
MALRLSFIKIYLDLKFGQDSTSILRIDWDGCDLNKWNVNKIELKLIQNYIKIN